MSFLEETDWKVSAIERTEPAICYWETDIPSTEIREAYGLPKHPQAALKFLGRGRLEGLSCKHCAGPIILTSRSNAIYRVNSLTKKSRFPRYSSAETCLDCAERIRLEYQRTYFQREEAEHAARRARRQELKTMPYRDFLQTEEWQSTRKEALRRARYSCQTCSAKGILHVHHRTYVRRGAELNSDLIVLCGDCHSLFHNNGKLAEGGRAS